MRSLHHHTGGFRVPTNTGAVVADFNAGNWKPDNGNFVVA